MSQLAGTIFLITTFPILFLCAFTDLRHMTISNRANIILVLIFVILGIFLLPLPDYGIRLLQGFIVLVIGFLLTTFGFIGGGDAKLLAAAAPYVAFEDVPEVFFTLSIVTLSALLGHRLLARIPQFKAEVADWVSWKEHRNFPFGVPISATLSFYLFLVSGFGYQF